MPEQRGLADRGRRVARGVLAAAVAAALCFGVASLFGSTASGRSEVMSYAVAHGWSPASMVAWFVAAAAFPVVAALLYLGRRRPSAATPESAPATTPAGYDSAPSATPVADHLGPRARGAVIGAVLGLEVAAVTVGRIAIVAVVVVGAALGAAVSTPRLGDVVRDRVHLVGIAAVVLGLFVVEARAGLMVNGTWRPVTWLPWWGIALVVGLAGAVVSARHRARGRGATLVRAIDEAVLAIVGPVGVVLLTTRLPGVLLWFDLFHEGEDLVPGAAVAHGAVPWRDVMFIHGVLQDVVRPVVGLRFIENSRWGAVAGETLWLVPAFWLSQYALAVWVHRGRRWVVVAQVALVTTASLTLWFFTTPMIRLITVPLICLAVGALSVPDRPRRAVGATLGALVVVSLAVSPETALAIAPIAVVTLALVAVDRRRLGRVDMARVASVLVGAVVTALACWAVLAALGAWSGFVDWFRTFTGYLMTGSHPIDTKSGRIVILLPLVLVPPVAMIVLALFRQRSQRGMRPPDWAMVALSAATLGYFQKFVGRPDAGHVLSITPLAGPVLVYLVAEAVEWVTPRLPTLAKRFAAVALAVVLVAVSAEGLRDESPFLRPDLGAARSVRRLGYISSTEGITAYPRDLARAVDAAGGRRGVFDVTNSPALFHYLLGYRSVSRFWNVNMAMSRASQERVVADLSARPPGVVVWSGPDLWFGLTVADDIPTATRHSLVADWVMERYRPYVKVHGYWLWVPVDAKLPDPATVDHDGDTSVVLDAAPECAWGRAPRFLAAGPSHASRRHAHSAPLGRADAAVLRGWARAGDAPVARLYAVANGVVVASGTPTDAPGRDLSDADRHATDVGEFSLFVDHTGRSFDRAALQVVAVDDHGRGVVIAGNPDLAAVPGVDDVTMTSSPNTAADRISGRLTSVGELGTAGTAVYRARVGHRRGDRWLTLHGTGPGRSHVMIGASPDLGRRSVTADIEAADGNTSSLDVGACSQWKLGGDWTYVRVDGGYRPTSIDVSP